MGVKQVVNITRSCDVCGKSVDFIQGQVTHEQLLESAGWIVLAQEHLVSGDQLVPVQKLVCSKGCAIRAINENLLALSKTQEFSSAIAANEPLDMERVN